MREIQKNALNSLTIIFSALVAGALLGPSIPVDQFNPILSGGVAGLIIAFGTASSDKQKLALVVFLSSAFPFVMFQLLSHWVVALLSILVALLIGLYLADRLVRRIA